MKDKKSVNNVTSPMAKNTTSVISTFTFINSLTTLVNVSVILKRKSKFSTLLRSEKKKLECFGGESYKNEEKTTSGKTF